ncbi:5'-methylthioadenosine phosphorylase [Chitinivorax tropicus]|uniref:Probable S-methyl-5'-thioinosine phosphorylase n=1 Tax=Chitinivorax tropicus TaxID=714531 RepID=A0A840MJA6_9PROT|nr:S-methyl-5'-thioinosine phosphorylase [Chitinivorax tropicus]MBB5016877.1 5'-methylthioadenosine phosphorylase [Chitinivorax tropicus]
MLAIIGGTGMTQLANLEITHRQVIRTPYGEPSGPLTFGRIKHHNVVFLARHGYGHTIPPHEINYRANIWALSSQKVKRIVAVASVGGIAAALKPGALAVPDQLIDYTYGRKFTFFEGGEKPVTHIDFTEPYSDKLRQRILKAAHAAQVAVSDGGIYAATQGPRLETAAEINRLERDGATMVGMTGMPEAALARELGIEYAALAVVANHAAGREPQGSAIDMAAIHAVLTGAMEQVRNVLEYVVDHDAD